MRKARADGVSRIGLLALVAGLIFGGATCADITANTVVAVRGAEGDGTITAERIRLGGVGRDSTP